MGDIIASLPFTGFKSGGVYLSLGYYGARSELAQTREMKGLMDALEVGKVSRYITTANQRRIELTFGSRMWGSETKAVGYIRCKTKRKRLRFGCGHIEPTVFRCITVTVRCRTIDRFSRKQDKISMFIP